MCSQVSYQQLIIVNLQKFKYSKVQLYNKMCCLKIYYNLFTHGPTHYDPFSALGTYENYRLQLLLTYFLLTYLLTYIHIYIHSYIYSFIHAYIHTYIHLFIPRIHKFVKIKVGCGISVNIQNMQCLITILCGNLVVHFTA
jgi:hypothetical protein